MSEDRFPGEQLRECREARGITLSDLYHRIHIHPRYIEALESGDLTQMPGEAYALGFLRTYCQFLDLDPEPFVLHFQSTRIAPPPRAAFSIPTNAEEETRAPWYQEAVSWGSICGVLLLAWITYAVLMRPFAERPEDSVDAGVVELAPPTHFEEEF